MVLRIDPPESSPAPGLITVVLRLSPVIVQNGGTIIGSPTSSYTPPFTKMIAGAVAVGTAILAQAYLTVLNAVSTDPPRPEASRPLVDT